MAALLLGAGTASAQMMSDDAIVDYVTTALAQGKSKNQIGTELIAKGVSAAQLKRVMANYQNSTKNSTAGTVNAIEATRADRKSPKEAAENVDPEKNSKKAETVEETPDKKDKDADKKVKTPVYGHDIFSNELLSFEPNDNAATPETYVLGPGDEVIIDVWGVGEASIRQKISPEGRIMVSQIGPIQLGGMSIKDATAKLKREFSKKYGGNAAQVSVSLGQIRTIRVNVMGDVKKPGSYRLSSFATVFTALHSAGGVTEVGTIRAIKVSRAGEQVATVDLYKYLFDGDPSCDITLRDGDIIVVPTYRNVVEVAGKVKRPMRYEMADGETLDKALAYAGGATADAYGEDVRVIRQNAGGQHVYSVETSKAGSFQLADGDKVEVDAAFEKYGNSLEVKGAVKRPGLYEFGSDIRTVSQLIARAGGLQEDAFTGRAQIVREKDDLSLEVIAIALKGILDGTVPDVLLKKNDVLFVANSNEITERGDFTINGCVAKPGKYEYAEHTTVEDLILLAGGLSEGASAVRVDVSRRINDPNSTQASEKLAEVFTFGIKDGLLADGTPDFELMPYDVVAVRRSPGYVEQRTVTITGEVAFPGEYTLTNSGETVSKLIERAGGPTPKAYLRGGVLRRNINEYEIIVSEALQNLSQKDAKDSLDVEQKDVYTVGVELDKAVLKPGSDYDIVLREGDEIIIPEATSTVSVQGEVLYPNTVNFVSGKGIGYYVNEAGGFGHRARRSKVYVVYMNGTVSSGRMSRIEPGCEIVVPTKPEKRPVTTGEIVSLGTTATSLVAVAMTVANLIKDTQK